MKIRSTELEDCMVVQQKKAAARFALLAAALLKLRWKLCLEFVQQLD